MKFPRVSLVLVLLIALVPATPVLAQYMYLDSNGDGIHTAADQVNPSGPTVIDVWIITNANRDGTPASCVTSSDPLDIFSYGIALRVENGTVRWGDYTNLQPQMGLNLTGPTQPVGQFYRAFGGPLPTLPPGKYLLGTLQTTVLTGSPSIQIGVPEPLDLLGRPRFSTTFGSTCLGHEFDNTIWLGIDWFDADGLPFGAGGTQNGAPVLARPSNMSLSAGELASQSLSATDPDLQPLTFALITGPGFAHVNTSDPGRGTGTGTVHLAPHKGDVGAATVAVGATDGSLSDQKSFEVTVTSADHPPVLYAPPRVDVPAGTVRRVQVQALDPDGQILTISEISGPEYLHVATLSNGTAAAAGSLLLTPGPCDVGSASAILSATDGSASTQAELTVFVKPLTKAPPSPPPYSSNQYIPVVATADLNSDGHLDVVVSARQFPTEIVTFFGKGDGSLQEGPHTPAGNGEPAGLAVDDFNGDGHPDVALTRPPLTTVGIFLGRGDGTFASGPELGPAPFPFGVTSGDVNRDGATDLLVANGSSAAVSLFLGKGDGTFEAMRGIDCGGSQREVTIADFNRDGLPDIAASSFEAKGIVVRLGFGDGTFDDSKVLPFDGGVPYAVIAGDWNWDGRADLAVSDYSKGRVVTFLGDGAGGFGAGVELGGFHTPQSLATADFNADGVPDLLVGDLSNELTAGESPTRIAYGLGDGRFGNPRSITGSPMWDVASGDLNEDGLPDAIAAGYGLVVSLNDAAGAGAAQARAFSRLANQRLLLALLAPECVRLEPVAGSYQNTDVNFRSIVLSSEGTGSVSEIPAIFEYRPIQRDLDRNGVAEIPVCFERRDLNRLFDKLRGRQVVTAHLQGALKDGRRFCTPVDMDIAGYKRRFAVFLTPNPLNPQATLSYSTSSDGFVRIRVFDLNGRLVRTLVDQPQVPAGDHAVIVDGRNQSGQRLASGIYFYQVETTEGEIRGRMTILK
ncbi:MAG: FG-GAP-like repeat-containing protein [Candidatus Eiseniibacteriota bacterium]